MRGEVFFEKITGISEEYITEAALVPAVGASPAKRPENRFAALSRVLNSGWGVACICFIVAIAAVVGMVAWGRMGDPTGPAGNGQFGFSYEILDENGQPLIGLVRPGYTVIVDTSIINQGDSFTYFGSESDYNAHAQFVMHTDERKTIQGVSTYTHDKGTHKVETGMSSNTRFIFTIPEDAAAGIYDLVLSYKGSQQVYPGVLMVEKAIDKPFPELTDDHPLSFGYEPFLSSTVSTGTELILEAWVVNDGEGFKVNGKFRPQATLRYSDEAVPYTIQGELIKEGISSTITYVESGATGRGAYTFDIPEDAPTGSYSLVLSFGGASQSFAGIVTVDDPSASSFSFGYEPFGGFAIPGDRLTIETWVRNDGEPFTYEGSSMGFAPTAVLIHMETQYRIDGSFGMDDDHGVFTVNTGDMRYVTQEFFIPADAPTGAYALKLSYGGVSKSFPGAVIVTHLVLDYPLLENGHPFSFGYQPFGNIAGPGEQFIMNAWVINEGDPFSFMGDPYSFQPTATLYHMGSDYTIGGLPPPTGVEPRPCNILTGQQGKSAYTFPIPADAPTGEYGLVLSYGGASQKFEGVLTVAEPTVIDPAVLYNLTMPIGSDWLYEPIDEAYVGGEEVTVRIKFATDVGTLFFLNGELITPSVGDNQHGYWRYHFIMPQKDSQILFHTYDGTAPYYKMLEACICSNPYGFREDLFYYYGEFGDGVMVALQLGYGEAIWSTTVGGYTFVTPNTHDMLAFYNGALYELQEAYDMGLLTDEHLEAMMTTHKEWFPDD